MEEEAQGKLLALRNTLGHVTLIQSWHLEIRPPGAALSRTPVKSEGLPCAGTKGQTHLSGLRVTHHLIALGSLLTDVSCFPRSPSSLCNTESHVPRILLLCENNQGGA